MLMSGPVAVVIGHGAILFVLTLVWILSVRLQDVSIVDIFWGLGYVVLAWVYFVLLSGFRTRAGMVAVIVTLWGLRLALHIFRPNHGKGEDVRYQAMRAAYGPTFWRGSLFRVFWLQGVILWFVALPLFAAARAPQPAEFTVSDGLGVLLFAIGFGFKSIGDWQLERFKSNPANRRVLDTGLWHYTRHPNYFGDATLWWGLYLIAASTPGGWPTVLSPAVMTLLLMRVSGVTLLEKGLTASKLGYREYIARTPSFVPWFPRTSGFRAPKGTGRGGRARQSPAPQRRRAFL